LISREKLAFGKICTVDDYRHRSVEFSRARRQCRTTEGKNYYHPRPFLQHLTPPRLARSCRLRFDNAAKLYNVSVIELLGYGMDMSNRLDATFLALADPTRRAILARLAHGEASVGELAAPFKISQPAVSKHLRILERAALISVGQDAQRRPRRIEAKPLAEASAWIEGFRQIWEANFERLDSLLEELQRDRPSKRGHQVKGKPR